MVDVSGNLINRFYQSALPVYPISFAAAGFIRIPFDRDHPGAVPLVDETDVGYSSFFFEVQTEDISSSGNRIFMNAESTPNPRQRGTCTATALPHASTECDAVGGYGRWKSLLLVLCSLLPIPNNMA